MKVKTQKSPKKLKKSKNWMLRKINYSEKLQATFGLIKRCKNGMKMTIGYSVAI